MKRKVSLMALGGILILVYLSYLFLPFLPLSFPPQEQFRADRNIRMALASVAQVWNVSEKDLYVFAVQNDTDNSTSVAIIDTESLASARVWIPAPGVEHEHSVAAFGPPDSDLHLLSQYTPRSPLERAIAKNFYTKSNVARSDKAVIVGVEADLPFGKLIANSFTIGELRYSTLFTYPLFYLAIHVDYF